MSLRSGTFTVTLRAWPVVGGLTFRPGFRRSLVMGSDMGSSANHGINVPTAMNIDHYLRLEPQQLAQLRLRHLDSQGDMEGPGLAAGQAGEGACVLQAISGYTEWLDVGGQGYSLGWDWYVQVPQGTLAVTPHSLRTNIMLTNAAGHDLGRRQTEASLEDWLQSWDWASTVWAVLGAGGQAQAPPQAGHHNF